MSFYRKTFPSIIIDEKVYSSVLFKRQVSNFPKEAAEQIWIENFRTLVARKKKNNNNKIIKQNNKNKVI